MKFNSLDYILLLFVTTLVFYHLPRRGRFYLLIGASLLFYAVWSVPLVSLIVISAIVDYSAGLMIDRSKSSRKRLGWLLLSLGVNLGLLGYFKYANFFIENIRAVMGNAPGGDLVHIILPPGISFYTFQTMSYTIDVYRGAISPTRSFPRFFLYVCFFPQLIAGPIERASHLLTQFDHVANCRFSMPNLVSGTRMIIWGLFKKVLIADYCGRIVDVVYGNPIGYDGWSVIVATYAFSLQIYCDFSAYSEIARGSARLFGVDLMRNFDQPYLAHNMSEFWRRWHISLSTWIRDYIYIPLGGSRGTLFKTIFVITITMFLSGLWHGAAWNFVLWGLYHGLLLVVFALFARLGIGRSFGKKFGRFSKAILVVLTFHLVAIGWILFRVDNLGDFANLLSAIGTTGMSLAAPTFAQSGFMLAMFLFLLLSHYARKDQWFDRINANRVLSVSFYSLLLAIVILFAQEDGPAFIYFQF